MISIVRERTFWVGILGVTVGAVLATGPVTQPLVQADSPDPPAMDTHAEVASGANGRTGVERLIPFQAYLTDAAGRPVEGQHALAFALYDDPTQGSPLWTETHSSVPVSKGLVNVILGGTTPFGSLTFDGTRYVAVRVDSGPELVPRQQVIPTIYAADSDRAKDALRLVTPGTLSPAVTVDTSGYVGIGTMSPARLLHLLGNAPMLKVEAATGASYFSLQVENTSYQFALTPTNDLYLEQDQIPRIVVKDGGNVGIGTLSPTNLLSIAGNADFSGNVGIGTTSPESKLHVKDDGTPAVIIIDGNYSTNPTLYFRQASEYSLIASGKDLRFRLMDAIPTDLVTISMERRVGIGTTDPQYTLDVAGATHATSFLTSSDARLKTNVRPLGAVLDKLEKVRGVSFEWNELYESLGRSTHRREIGVIAQEVEEQFPELVSCWGPEQYRAVDYGRTTAVLIEAVREVRVEKNGDIQRLRAEKDAQIETLQKRNGELEARLAALEAVVNRIVEAETGAKP